jgi:hypothetical protein
VLTFLKNIFFKRSDSDFIKNYIQNYKSDKRISGGKNGICILCDTNALLRLSHIVPKWAYHWCKEEGAIVGDYGSLNVRTKEQDGNKHYLLCDKCEQHLGTTERYIKILMHGTESERKSLGIKRNGADYTGLNFGTIKRFICGLVLKSHFATSAPFHRIQLTAMDIALLKGEIAAPSPDDLSLMTVAMQFYSDDPEVDPKAIMIPHQIDAKKGKYVSFIIAGWEWILFFNTRRNAIHKNFTYMRLLQNGEMRIPSGNILEQRHIMNRLRIKPKN